MKPKKVVRQAILVAIKRLILQEITVMKLELARESGILIFFLTTKVPTAVKDYEGTKKSIDEALEKFSLDYIDLLCKWNKR